jgi:hypothetical protein
MIAERIKTKRPKLGLQNKNIYPGEENMISAIANNRRNDQKNKYLIPADTSRSAAPKGYTTTIASNLKFASPKELLWGNHSEIRAYGGELFFQMIMDALQYENQEVCNQIYMVLTDYIPFAMEKYLYDSSEKFSSQHVIDEKTETDESEFICSRKDAISRLYDMIHVEFMGLLEKFYSDKPPTYKFSIGRPDTYKLNKRMSMFVVEKLLPLMMDTIFPYSIGSEAKIIINIRTQRTDERLNNKLGLSHDVDKQETYEIDYLEKHTGVIKDLIKADVDYISHLADIQFNEEGGFSDALLNNTWTPEMCLETEDA